ncbi:MAG: tyrosine--tRNA ligase [Candidatus Caldatribacteriota bacterium]|nr:tyrosine--tRNA ligase [Atribacterota bacterium]MDD3640553.1 tyrosine--tRNA ligase [Atribacterota bacterium]MDD4288649.1 tyrosine--tRNA ligase [Atribacterota bacterium]MDD4765604.1 tyrosine--tRNA ligase [Atribacterota bacterium]
MDLSEEMKIIKRGTDEIISEEELKNKLRNSKKSKKPLRIKQGFDPSAPDIHLGHTVGLRKLRHFQDLGHDVYFLIGDFTGMIGDPSGRSSTRKQLTTVEVKKNAETYKEQVFKILDPNKTIVEFNSHWLGKLSFVDVIHLCSKYTVARMLERDDFSNRFQEKKPIGVHEFLYPLMQGYDSVSLKADVELGGTDQKFNLLVGRDLQREFGQEPQVIITMPIIEGTDGVEKMSKSLGNYIGINEKPNDMYGKIMSIPDKLMEIYFRLLTDVPEQQINQIKKDLQANNVHPRDIKKRLAKEIVKIYHGYSNANQAENHFEQVFQEKMDPENSQKLLIPIRDLSENKLWIVKLVKMTKALTSTGEAIRIIKQGGVRINHKKITNPNTDIVVKDGDILRIGKLNFYQLKIN